MFTSPVFFVASAFFVAEVVLAVLAGVAAGVLLLSVVVVFEGTIVLLSSDGVTTGEGVTFSSVFLFITTVAIAVGENFVNVATTFPSAPSLVGNATHCPSWKWRTWIPSE